jgi:hypothetical protein
MNGNAASFPANDELGKNALGDEFDGVQDGELVESVAALGGQVLPARLQSVSAWAGVENDAHRSSIRPAEEALDCLVGCSVCARSKPLDEKGTPQQ